MTRCHYLNLSPSVEQSRQGGPGRVGSVEESRPLTQDDIPRIIKEFFNPLLPPAIPLLPKLLRLRVPALVPPSGGGIREGGRVCHCPLREVLRNPPSTSPASSNAIRRNHQQLLVHLLMRA